ncbi:MAG: hypothetical protein PVS3B3_39710 [Ktedonobacteraceae bacterium]
MNTPTVLSGSLQEFGLVEVLQVVELGGMTGAIQLRKNTGQTGIIYCNEGKVANCSEFDPLALTLGDVLQQLGMATHRQIEAAFSQQLSDVVGKRIGERLIAMRVINETQLREALRTKALWTARELAMWPEGTYEFIASPNVQKLLPYNDVPLNIEVMRATMEIVRYSDEWQTLGVSLPVQMRTMLRLADEIPRAMNFHRHTLEMFMLINNYRRVRRIASAIRRPELDVAQELAQLVQQRLVVPIFQEQRYHGKSRKMRLPEAAEMLRMENFQLLDLISRMEQEWEKHHTPTEQLPTLVRFVNWTMDALIDAYRSSRTELDPTMLKMLLTNENLLYMGNYEFRVDHNNIDVDDFKNLCNAVMNDSMHAASDFYDEASSVLQRMLRTIFSAINARVVSPLERLENQEVWEAMFEQFALTRTGVM